MTRINDVQQKIKQLNGGEFQKLCDAYLIKKYRFKKFTVLGSQEGTNKTTKGVPDSYVENDDGSYIFIMYGTTVNPKIKISEDIKACLEKAETIGGISKLSRIICCHTSTNISVEQNEQFKKEANGVELELIGLSSLAQDMASPAFQSLSLDFLSVEFDSAQIFDIDGFISANENDATSPSLSLNFKFRENELQEINDCLEKNIAVLVSGDPGVGKSRICLEVCKAFQETSYQVLCVKNNGLSLNNDFKVYTSDPGRYLIFLDDINLTTDLDSVINWISISSNQNNNSEFKIIATVRDYAKKGVGEKLKKLGDVHEIKIHKFKDDELKEIVSDGLQIENIHLQDRILQIAKGNARLAVLAGQLSTEKLELINNPSELFRGYYSVVIDAGEITDLATKVLFIISLSNTVFIEKDELAKTLLREFEISEKEFHDTTRELYQKELVNIYSDKVVKINDQSFGDYILEYALIESKFISINKLLELGFSIEPSKIHYALVTIINLFQSKEILNYIRDEINERWDNVNEEDGTNYLEFFYQFNYTKALGIIYNRINKMNKISFKVTKKYIEQNKNYQVYKSSEMQILSNFKNTEFFEQAIIFSLMLLDKRPDYFMDIYFAFTKNFSYDIESARLGFKRELTMLEGLNSSTGEDNVYRYYLLLDVIKELLKTSASPIEQGGGNNTLVTYYIQFQLTEEYKKLRKKIWEILANLYSKKDLDLHELNLQGEVLKILSTSHWTGETSKVKPILEFDMTCITEKFINTWDTLSLEETLSLTMLSNNAKSLHMNVDRYFEKYANLPEKKYYDIIKPRSFSDIWQKDQNMLAQQIKGLINNFDESDFHELFQLAKKMERVDNIPQKEQIGSNIKIAIDNAPVDILKEVFTDYLNESAPFSSVNFIQNSGIFDKLGFDTCYQLLNQFNFLGKNKWISTSFEYLQPEEINDEKTKLLTEFIKLQAKEESPSFPRLETIVKFIQLNSNIVIETARIVIDLSDNNESLAHNFILPYMNEPVALIQIFKTNVNVLEDLYMQIKDPYFDYDKKILTEIIKVNPNFWDRYILSLKEKNVVQSDLFTHIWELDNFNDLINIAVETLIQDNPFSSPYNTYKAIFSTQSPTDEVNRRIQNWIASYFERIIKNKKQIYGMFLFYINDQNVETRIFFIKMFLNYYPDIDDFKKIPIEPIVRTYSNSEVPVIDAEISFLEQLVLSDFMRNRPIHQLYIKNLIDEKKRIKKEIELKEYQENID
jgi:hypothetical protein